MSDGDRFEEMVSSYHTSLVKCLMALLREGRRDDAEDLAQAVWSEVWCDMDKPPAEGGWDRKWSFMTYLQYKARFKVADFNRRSALNRLRFSDSLLDASSEIDSVSETDSGELAPDVHRELLRLVMRCGGHPYEVLAFCMSRLVHSRTASFGNARTVAGLYAAEQLEVMASAFVERYRGADFSSLESKRDIESAVYPLSERLSTTGAALLSRDGPTRRHYTHLEGKIVGRNRLTDYFLTDTPPKTISKWTDKVRRNLLATVVSPESRCSKCRFYPVDGCRVQDKTGGGPLRHLGELELGSLARGALQGHEAVQAMAHIQSCTSCSDRLRAWMLIVANPETVVASWLGSGRAACQRHTLAPGLASALAELTERLPDLKGLVGAALKGALPLVRVADAVQASVSSSLATALFEAPALSCMPMEFSSAEPPYTMGANVGRPRLLSLSADNPVGDIVVDGMAVGSASLDSTAGTITVLLEHTAGLSSTAALLYDTSREVVVYGEFKPSATVGWLMARFDGVADGEYEIYVV